MPTMADAQRGGTTVGSGSLGQDLASLTASVLDAPPADDTAPVDGEQPSDDTTPDSPGIPFRALLIQEGVETSDDRFLQPNALTWREPPVPLMVQLKSEHGG